MASEYCDIAFFIPACMVFPESSPGAADGAITVLATSTTSGTKKYKIVSVTTGAGGGGSGDFDYNTDGDPSGLFTGLTAGTYRIMARVSNSCGTTIDLTVTQATQYNLRFFNQYYDTQPAQVNLWRWEIHKQDYAGDPVQAQGTCSIVWGKQGDGDEDPFTAIISSSCNIDLLSETDEQYEELSTNYEREFIVKVFLNGSLYWYGYLLTGQGTEPYAQLRNYPVTVVAADMLQNLSEISFGNRSGEFPQTRITIMDAILMCLHQTDIELDVYEGIQLVVDGVSDSFDETSMAETVYFDPLVYFDDEAASCYDVLDSILRNFWSRIYQANGKWFIETVTQKGGGTMNYRTRDFQGEVTGAGYIETEPRLMIRKSSSPGPRLVFAEQTQERKLTETFGRITIIHDFGIKDQNNILVNGNFVNVDIDNGQLEGWQIDYTTAPFIGVEIVTTTDAGATYDSLKFTSTGVGITSTEIVTVDSTPIHLADPGLDYVIRISFEVLMGPFEPQVYTYFDYSVRMLDSDLPGDVYVLAEIDPDTGLRRIGSPGSGDLIDNEWIRVYVDDPNKWTKIQLETVVRQVGSFQSGDFQIRLRFGMNPTYDYATAAELENETTLNITSTQTFNNRRKIKGEGTQTGYVLLYELEVSDDTASYPEVIEPDDFGGSNNFKWILKKKVLDINVTPVFRETWFNTAIARNVKVEYLPDGDSPEEESSYPSIVETRIRHDKEVTIKHADIVGDQNYQVISRGWLSYEDGTPTGSDWKVRPSGGGGMTQKTLITQMGNAYRGQFAPTARRRKLSGQFDDRQCIPSLFNSFFEIRKGKIFLPYYLEVFTKEALADWQGLEVLAGSPITDSGIIDPANPAVPIEPPDPAAGRVHTAAFAVAFN